MRKRFAMLAAGAVVLAMALPAGAVDFSPQTRFRLSTRVVKENPKVTIKVSQDKGEEELDRVRLVVPAGFRIAGDAAIEDGTQIGQGSITIALEPACTAEGSLNSNATLKDKDRTPAQKSKGVKAVWHLNIQNVVSFDLLVRGSAADGWSIRGNIPSNDATCTPFQFVGKIYDKAQGTQTKVMVNPANAGTYTFVAVWTGVDGDKYTQKQKVQITNA